MQVDFAAMLSRYEAEETETLIRIVNFDAANYTEEAVAAARQVLQQRGVATDDDTLIDAVQSARVLEQHESEVLAKRPLGPLFKLACFVGPLLTPIIIALMHKVSGKQRAVREALRYWGYGWLFRLALVLAIAAWQRL